MSMSIFPSLIAGIIISENDYKESELDKIDPRCLTCDHRQSHHKPNCKVDVGFFRSKECKCNNFKQQNIQKQQTKVTEGSLQ